MRLRGDVTERCYGSLHLLFEDIGGVLISHRETNRQLGPVLVSVSQLTALKALDKPRTHLHSQCGAHRKF